MSRARQNFWLSLLIVAGGALPIILFATGAFPGAELAGAGDLGGNLSASAQCMAPSLRSLSMIDQWMTVVTGFGIKPIYILIATVLVCWLWKQKSPDLAALRWGLIFFWLGENACSVNYLAFKGRSDLWEFFHNYGMAVAFSFVAYAVIEGIDLRILKYSAPRERCGMLSLCRACIKYDASVSCNLQRLFLMMLPATILLATIPLCATLVPTSYTVAILGSTETFSLPLSSQLFEIRYCPLLGMALLTASWLVLLFKREPLHLAKILAAAAIGPIGFGFMRLFLGTAFRDRLQWFNEWEELSELLFTMAVALVLWTFRRALFESDKQKSAI
jgi:hypothetical protein